MRKDVYRLSNYTAPKPKAGSIVCFIKGEKIDFDIIGNQLKLNRKKVDSYPEPRLVNVWSYRTEEELDILLESEHLEKLNSELSATIKQSHKKLKVKRQYIIDLEDKVAEILRAKSELGTTLNNSRDINNILGANIIEANKTRKKIVGDIEARQKIIDDKFISYHNQMSEFRKGTNETLVQANKSLSRVRAIVDNIPKAVKLGMKEIFDYKKSIMDNLNQARKEVSVFASQLEGKVLKYRQSLKEKKDEGLKEIKEAIEKGQEPRTEIKLKDRGDGKITEVYTIYGRIETK